MVDGALKWMQQPNPRTNITINYIITNIIWVHALQFKYLKFLISCKAQIIWMTSNMTLWKCIQYLRIINTVAHFFRWVRTIYLREVLFRITSKIQERMFCRIRSATQVN